MPYPILLIDDDPAYCRLLQDEAKKFRFIITYFDNLEDGLEELKKSRRMKAVILDDRCKLESRQLEASKANFVFHAMQQLADIEHHYNRSIPFCVNSVKPDEFREELEGITPVFVKKADHEQMFHWIKDAIDQLPETAIRREYSEIFEKVALIFNEDQQEMLIDVIQKRGITDSASIVTSMAILRRLLENLVNAVCLKHLGKHPEYFVNGQNGSRTRQILEAMHPRILPPELFSTATQLYKTCSKYGNHDIRHSISNNFVPTTFTLTRLTYTFLELFDYLINDTKWNNFEKGNEQIKNADFLP